MLENSIFLFVHIPKTGGDTVRRHLWLYMDRRHRIALDARAGDNHVRLESLSSAQREACRLLLGHGVRLEFASYFTGRTPRFFTILRDPVAHAISSYNWYAYRAQHAYGTEPKTFEDWFTPDYYSLMARWLLTSFAGRPIADVANWKQQQILPEAAALLERFWLVATLENLERSLGPAFQALRVPRRIRRKSKVAGVDFPRRAERTPEIEALVRSCATADMRLYEQYGGFHAK